MASGFTFWGLGFGAYLEVYGITLWGVRLVLPGGLLWDPVTTYHWAYHFVYNGYPNSK